VPAVTFRQLHRVVAEDASHLRLVRQQGARVELRRRVHGQESRPRKDVPAQDTARRVGASQVRCRRLPAVRPCVTSRCITASA